MGQYCAFSVKILLSCWALLVLESFPLSVRWTIYPRVPEAVLLGVGQMGPSCRNPALPVQLLVDTSVADLL